MFKIEDKDLKTIWNIAHSKPMNSPEQAVEVKVQNFDRYTYIKSLDFLRANKSFICDAAVIEHPTCYSDSDTTYHQTISCLSQSNSSNTSVYQIREMYSTQNK